MKLQLLVLSLFLSTSFAYTQITSVGLIGDATPGGWDVDTNMMQDPDSAHLWSLRIELTDGFAKFRADDDWTVNWGAADFPMGVGVQDGPDIPVQAGLTDVTFNSNTGEYYFSAVSPVGIIGDATFKGWDADINLYPDSANSTGFHITLDLTMGEAKFRLDDDWAVNWGAEDFPSGIGVQDGANIPIPNAGEYEITFDTLTGAYNFKENVAYDSVAIFGDAANGWDTFVNMARSDSDPAGWTITTQLSEGGLQFAGNGGEIIWGGPDFPEGFAVADGDTIPVTAGKWIIDFNTNTGAYTFTLLPIYGSMGIIGDATPGGWDTDTDMERLPSDSSAWQLRLDLTDGEAKFRADNDWANNWGASDFPSGVAEPDGANIIVTAGDYLISFNSFTLVYNFQEIVEYDTIGLIGTGTPFMNWDDDVFMDKDPDDFNMWTISEVTLVDGEVKFRVNQDWAVNWGDPAWPEGIGTQDGPNILCEAGTYGVTLNSGTGEYAFGDPITSSTQDLLKPTDITAYPNPAAQTLNIDLSNVDMSGELTLRLYDMSGKLVSLQIRDAADLVQMDVSGVQPGQYALQITSDKYIIGKRVAVSR